MSLVSFIDNPKEEAKRIQKEEEEKIKHSDELMYKDESIEKENGSIDDNTDDNKE